MMSREIFQTSGKKVKRPVSSKESPDQSDSLNRKAGSTRGQTKTTKSILTAKVSLFRACFNSFYLQDVSTARSTNRRHSENNKERDDDVNEELLNVSLFRMTLIYF